VLGKRSIFPSLLRFLTEVPVTKDRLAIEKQTHLFHISVLRDKDIPFLQVKDGHLLNEGLMSHFWGKSENDSQVTGRMRRR
jgi:hypothetical protein